MKKRKRLTLKITNLKIVGGDHNLIVGCVFRNLGNNAVVVDGGNHNGVKSSDLYHLAGCGILLVGGDRMTLTPGNNFVENSHLYRFGRVFRTYAPAIQMKGVGNRLAHNLIHDGPHAGVVFHGNEHVLEYNEIYDIAKETGDVGAFYIGRDWTYRGNIIRYNYFHDLHGPGLHGVRATYLDDFTSGITIFGNVFYRAGRAAFIGGGRDNVVENNIFVECNPSVQIDARGLSWAHYYFDKSHKNYVNTLWDRMEAVHYQQPPYSIKYPELLKYASDDPAVPKNNKVIRNISYGGNFLDLYDGIGFDIITVKDNVIADSIILRWSEKPDQVKEFRIYHRGDSLLAEKMKGNKFVDGDPGFVDAEKGDFRLKKDCIVYQLGFQPIDFDRIGLIEDEFRKNLPE